MFPWKKRSEIQLTDVNGNVTSDLMVGKGKELQGSQNSSRNELTCKKEIVALTFFHRGALQAHHWNACCAVSSERFNKRFQSFLHP